MLYGHSSQSRYEQPNPRRTHVILTVEDVASGKESGWFELEITGSVRNLSPQLWTLTHLTSLYLNDNNLTKLPPEIAKLEHLHHLDLSNNKLRSLPSEIGELIMLKELNLSNNTLRQLPYELGKLFQLQILNLKHNPLTAELMVIYSEPNGTAKLLSYLLDNLSVPDVLPPKRPWLPLRQPTKSHHVSNVFTVMCYNVLCDKYATRQLYGYCPNWVLAWEHRRLAIMQEIKNYDADIISLQEVETEQFYSFFLPELMRVKYDGIFSPKSRAKTMNESERKHVDGCAIFFKTEKFELKNQHLIEFNRLAMANAEGSEEMLNRVMTKDNIGLVALLQTKEVEIETSDPQFENMQPFESQPLVVCTAHIHWDPEFCDVKLIQTMMMMNELKSFVDESVKVLQNQSSNNVTYDAKSIPLIMCGDLNSLPDSGVVEFLNKGRISVEHPDFRNLAYKDSLRKICPILDKNANEYMHAFDMIKAYDDGIMPFTNYTFDFRGVIDYIFCSRQLLLVLGVLGPLDSDWFTKNKVPGCPHQHIPSDHFPLVVELELLTKQSLAEFKKEKQENELNNSSMLKNNNSTNTNGGGGSVILRR